ncbi:MAG: ATP-dependent DNA helicase [Candidatus Eisenbacteria bacterium]
MTLSRRVESMLAPDGALGRRWPRFEDRSSQRQLGAAMAATMERGGLLLAEAPTGVGKSLAYLLPAALMAGPGCRVMIATCTRSLQDQLYERDLPALRAALDLPLPAVCVKGKQNYVCPRALDSVEARDADEQRVLDRVRGWAAVDPTGDLDRYPGADGESFRRLRARIATDPAGCTALTCRRTRDCFWVRARREAAAAPIVIVNHALLALSGEIEGLLPDFDVLVVDEAHRLEGVLLGQLECATSAGRFDEVLRTAGPGARRGTRGSGLLGRVRGWLSGGFADPERREVPERLGQRVEEMRQAVPRLFERLEPQGERHAIYGLRERYRNREELLGRELEELETVLSAGTGIARALGSLAAELGAEREATAQGLGAECEALGARLAGLTLDLDRLTEARDPDWVFWRNAGSRGVELRGSPVSVGAHARERVLGRSRACVLTSATLSAAGDFAFLADRLGLGETHGAPYESLTVDSPFPLATQMEVLIAPAAVREEAGVAEVVEALARRTGRNQLVLFTAHERLKRVRERLLTALGEGLLAQEWDGPLTSLTERFRAARGSVLLGVQSLWEGVDFPGESLEILVVARLPFSVPDDPVVAARGERLAARGRDPFRDDALPEAVLRFRQGIGRLIRRSDDRGVLVVCDPRLATASYRRAFLSALPVAPKVMPDVETLATEAARFLAAETVEDGT